MVRNSFKISFRIITVLALFFTLSSNSKNTYIYDGLVVITNSKNKTTQMKKKEFEKYIFGEKQTWPGGGTVYLALLKSSHPVGLKVAKDVFDMASNEFNKYWLGLVFEGKCKAPSSFSSEEDLINYVAQTPGAIGVVSSAANISNVTKINISN